MTEGELTCGFCGLKAQRMEFGYYAKPQKGYGEIVKCPRCKRYQAPLGIDSESVEPYIVRKDTTGP